MHSSGGDSLEGKRISERYRIKQVRKWTQNTVFCSAEDMAEARLVDLILINSEAIGELASFQKKMTGKLKLKHKNIRRIISFGTAADGEQFIALKTQDTKTLKSRLESKSLSLKQSIDLILQLIDGLIYIQGMSEPASLPYPAGITLSPAAKTVLKLNPLELGEQILPFELIREYDLSSLERALYTAPECLKGAAVTQKSQIYAVAVILYELITAKALYEADDLVELESQHLSVAPKRFHERRPDLYFEPRLEAVVLKALEKDPVNRQASLRHLKFELQEAISPYPYLFKLQRSALAASCLLVILGLSFASLNLLRHQDPAFVAKHETQIASQALESFKEAYSESLPEETSAPQHVVSEIKTTKPPMKEISPNLAASFLEAFKHPDMEKMPEHVVRLGSLKLSGSQQKVLKAGDYCCEKIELSDNAQLLNKGKVRLWLLPTSSDNPSFIMSGASRLSSSGISEQLKIFDAGGAAIKISGKSKLKADVVAPLVLLDAFDDACIEGKFISNGQRLNDRARFVGGE
ncbi:MAG: hypothetical protein K2X27_24530 [Candidatus Obscuribacterales bacterium]|nr:hypothetical protein [Candidatus Obscuribacterales bacterium]